MEGREKVGHGYDRANSSDDSLGDCQCSGNCYNGKTPQRHETEEETQKATFNR